MQAAPSPIRRDLERVVICRPAERVMRDRRAGSTKDGVASAVTRIRPVQIHRQRCRSVKGDRSSQRGILVFRQPGTPKRHRVERNVLHEMSRLRADVRHVQQDIQRQLALNPGTVVVRSRHFAVRRERRDLQRESRRSGTGNRREIAIEHLGQLHVGRVRQVVGGVSNSGRRNAFIEDRAACTHHGLVGCRIGEADAWSPLRSLAIDKASWHAVLPAPPDRCEYLRNRRRWHANQDRGRDCSADWILRDALGIRQAPADTEHAFAGS